jgi:hypothetical protein
MTPSETPSPPRRRLRYFLISLAAFAVTIALFYAEEDWRGWRAMEKCKRKLEAQGVTLDWKKKIPAPVPDNENVFGVPEMQKWFVKSDRNQTNELTEMLHFPGYDGKARMVVGQLTVGLPGTNCLSGAVVLQWENPKAKAEAARLLKDALGPAVMDPLGFNFILRQPGEIRPAQIFLQCQTAPTEKELLDFLPKPIVDTALFKPIFNGTAQNTEKIQVEPTGNGSYNVTMLAPIAAAEFLKWSEQLEPEFTLIRKALQRPHALMKGDYSVPSEMPIPNYVAVRIISQRLVAIADCQFLTGHPEEALRDMTLIHDICRRILEENKPMTLVSAMINVAVRGLYASSIADSLRLQAWREPQLAALEAQLEQINLLGPVKQASEGERFSVWYHLATLSPDQYLKMIYVDYTDPSKTNSWKVRENLILWRFIPRGWGHQNMVTAVNLYATAVASLDPAGQIVFPDKLEAFNKKFDAVANHWSPYAFMSWPQTPNYTRAFQTTTRNQTMVNQALIACALERYHLAHGEYPETLDALLPQFIGAIPHDIIGGRPPHYRRNSDGTFLLYSIGWSQKDHGGQTNPTPSYPTTLQYDLVWPEQ